MGKRLTTEEFIRRARELHGDRYDYSKVEYVDTRTKVCIICPVHGEFWQTYDNHVGSQCDCPKCAIDKKKLRICGVGVNDMEESIRKYSKAYDLWRGIIRRCYDESILDKHPTYRGCSICEEWKRFSAFASWCNKNYINGWHLDKDILVKGNKVYSPETCCFVPQEINKLFTKRQLDRGDNPIGVVRCICNKYVAAINKNGIPIHIGLFSSPEEAFLAYKEAKEAWIKEVADKWKDKLDQKVYKALYEYQVEITD